METRRLLVMSALVAFASACGNGQMVPLDTDSQSHDSHGPTDATDTSIQDVVADVSADVPVSADAVDSAPGDVVDGSDSTASQDAPPVDGDHGPCGAMWWCPVDGGSAMCVDLTADPANCGACENACPSGESCVSGECACPTGQTYCPGPDGGPGGGCLDLQSTPGACGSCTNNCNATSLGWVCYFGQCARNCGSSGAPPCPSGDYCCAASAACIPTGATCM